MKSRISLLFFFLLLMTSVYALSIGGQSMKIMIDHVPGYTRTDTFYITNNEGYTSSYTINPTNEKGGIPPGTFVVTPSRMENVQNGETRSFTVKVTLPETIDSAGDNEVWVQARLDDTATGGVIMAVPSVAIRYIVYVLYPYKYVRYEFNAPNMNVNESSEFIVSMTNLGTPTIDLAKASIEIFDSESDTKIAQIETPPVLGIKSREIKQLKAKFDSKGLKPGNYKAVATIYWDQNISNDTKEFRIGTKNVKILDFPKKFEVSAINKMDISVESAWNTKIKEIQAAVIIIDPATKKKVKEFKSFPASLEPWEVKSLESYFDTTGLEKKDYLAQILLNYEGAESSIESTITVGENINAVVVKEIPGRFKLDFSQLGSYITPMSILVFLILVFLIINMFLIYSVLKRKSKKDVLVDEAVVNKVIGLISQYKDEYVKEMMIKKGWKEEEIRIILEEAKRRTKK